MLDRIKIFLQESKEEWKHVLLKRSLGGDDD